MKKDGAKDKDHRLSSSSKVVVANKIVIKQEQEPTTNGGSAVGASPISPVSGEDDTGVEISKDLGRAASSSVGRTAPAPPEQKQLSREQKLRDEIKALELAIRSPRDPLAIDTPLDHLVKKPVAARSTSSLDMALDDLRGEHRGTSARGHHGEEPSSKGPYRHFKDAPKHRPAKVAPASYKTELCNAFENNGYCKFGKNCWNAHGKDEERCWNAHGCFEPNCRYLHITESGFAWDMKKGAFRTNNGRADNPTPRVVGGLHLSADRDSGPRGEPSDRRRDRSRDRKRRDEALEVRPRGRDILGGLSPAAPPARAKPPEDVAWPRGRCERPPGSLSLALQAESAAPPLELKRPKPSSTVLTKGPGGGGGGDAARASGSVELTKRPGARGRAASPALLTKGPRGDPLEIKTRKEARHPDLKATLKTRKEAIGSSGARARELSPPRSGARGAVPYVKLNAENDHSWEKNGKVGANGNNAVGYSSTSKGVGKDGSTSAKGKNKGGKKGKGKKASKMNWDGSSSGVWAGASGDWKDDGSDWDGSGDWYYY